MLHAIHIVAGLDAAYGGPSYSVPRLCQALGAAGARATLLSVANAGEPATESVRNGYTDRRFAQDYAKAPVLRALRWSSALGRTLREAAESGDIIHNHGLWLMPNIQAGWAAQRAGRPLVMSPRGMLAPAALAFSPVKKKVFWHLLQRSVVRRVACLHATCEAEYAEIRAFGLTNAVAVIPNGIDLPVHPVTQAAGQREERVVLSLGRIHPKKGLDRLLHAWAKVEPTHPGWRLRIVGPGERGHEVELKALAAALSLAHISIEGPIYGEAKQDIYAGADLFVLPSLNENFGLTVAEALACATPVIASTGTPWQGLEREGCGWWVEHGVAALAAALEKAMVMSPVALQAMGCKGRAWMERDFSWDHIALEMDKVYRWLKGALDKPSSVHQN